MCDVRALALQVPSVHDFAHAVRHYPATQVRVTHLSAAICPDAGGSSNVSSLQRGVSCELAPASANQFPTACFTAAGAAASKMAAAVRSKVFFDIAIGGKVAGRVEFGEAAVAGRMVPRSRALRMRHPTPPLWSWRRCTVRLCRALQ